jgi:mannitol/fructose-specific phosphotransferase system IIA component (Ntr-type)
MKTFTVFVFLGVNAETKQEAIEKAISMLEYSLDIHEDNDFPYCDIGNLNEVIEQEEQS